MLEGEGHNGDICVKADEKVVTANVDKPNIVDNTAHNSGNYVNSVSARVEKKPPRPTNRVEKKPRRPTKLVVAKKSEQAAKPFHCSKCVALGEPDSVSRGHRSNSQKCPNIGKEMPTKTKVN